MVNPKVLERIRSKTSINPVRDRAARLRSSEKRGRERGEACSPACASAQHSKGDEMLDTKDRDVVAEQRELF